MQRKRAGWDARLGRVVEVYDDRGPGECHPHPGGSLPRPGMTPLRRTRTPEDGMVGPRGANAKPGVRANKEA
jgi:hypothetical protein